MSDVDQVELEDNPFKDWVTLEEAAKLVGFKHATVTYWSKNGYIKTYLIGQRVRVVRKADVIAFAEERRHTRKLNKYVRREG